MPMSESAARKTLEQWEALARLEEDGMYHKKFGSSFFSVITSEGCGTSYQWGINQVTKATAVNVVQTFGEVPRRS